MCKYLKGRDGEEKEEKSTGKGLQREGLMGDDDDDGDDDDVFDDDVMMMRERKRERLPGSVVSA